MSEVKLARSRIKEGKEERLRDWYAELERREDEVVETLEHEDVYTESAFIASFEETSYLYVYMEAADLQKALEAGDKEEFKIDEEHHAVLEDCLIGGWEDLEPVGHLTNPARD